MCLLMLQVQSHCCLDYIYNKSYFKKKIAVQKFCVILNVRPHKVVQAEKWLINNSTLYKKIALCENWQNSQESDFDISVHDKSECNLQVEASNTDSETLRESPAEDHAGKSTLHITDSPETWHTFKPH